MKFVAAKPELCKGCKACEEACAKVLYKDTDTEKSAIIVMPNNDSGFNINVCSQCGECIDICPVQAIYRNKNGVVMINKDTCVHCFACVGFCSILAMRYHKDVVGPYKCISCGACTRACSTGAIYMEEEE